ncbi:MAG TPA: DedA family protein [Dissulfurispiraceae bacterium]|nr:DedA family protein [Dissulfurispiraceae bacterium]
MISPAELVDFILHFDKYLQSFIQIYGVWTYAILFLIVFSETGFVVTPFLPGDSLLFVCGAFAATGAFELATLFGVLSAAAILGNVVNYQVGVFVGPKVFSREKSRFLKKEYLDRTHRFYEKHGGKAVVIARFLPIIRTFAPFVAGIGRMNYAMFTFYNVVGCVAWIASFVLAGYFFGNIPAVKRNFTIVIMAIIVISIIPSIVEVLRHRKKPDNN